MKRLILRTLVLAALLAAAISPALADHPTNPARDVFLDRPTVSPYLNLLTRNQFGISTYHSIVRPMMEQREQSRQQSSQIQRMQQQMQESQLAQRQQAAAGLRPTGHPTGYMNYMQYYPGFANLHRRR